MRYHEIISESPVSPALLYHGTNINRVISIFQQDQLKGNNTPHGVSLTRDLRAAIKFSKKFGDGSLGSDNDGAVIVFDRDGLARTFGRKLVPIDRAQATPMGPRSESEERLLGDPSGIVQFIIRIIVNDMRRFDHIAASMIEQHPMLQPVIGSLRSKLVL